MDMNMDPDLFPEARSLSPKLAWLQKHRLHTRLDELPRCYIGPQNTQPWTCANAGRTIVTFADTEEEAIYKYCACCNIKHWLIEAHEKEIDAAKNTPVLAVPTEVQCARDSEPPADLPQNQGADTLQGDC